MSQPSRPAGRPIRGPGAFGSDPRHFWRLTWTLATTDFKLRFFGSALGYLWQLMRPLMLFAVMYVIFTVVLGVGEGQPLYGLALLLGIVLFQFFTDSVSGAVTSIVAREGLIRKVDFPRLAIPLACVLQALFNLALNLIAVLVFLIFAGGSVLASWVQFPLIVLMLSACAASLPPSPPQPLDPVKLTPLPASVLKIDSRASGLYLQKALNWKLKVENLSDSETPK